MNDDSRKQELHQIAVELRRLGRLRINSLPQEYFGEVAWDILLTLYISHERDRLSVTTLTSELSASMTTVLRWLSHLEGEGRVANLGHPTDKRIRHLALTDLGRRELDGYFLEVLRSSNFVAIK